MVMTVKQLVELLQAFDESLPVVTQRYSDYKLITTDDIYPTKVRVLEFKDDDEWLTRYYEDQHEKGTRTPVDVLFIIGN